MEYGASRYPLSSLFLIDRERKRFLASARNDNMGKATFSYLPPSAGRRCPKGAEARSCYQLKKNVRYAFPRIVIPSAAEGSFLHCGQYHIGTDTETTPWCYVFLLSHMHRLSVCKKDFSATLSMTIRERRMSHSHQSLVTSH